MKQSNVSVWLKIFTIGIFFISGIAASHAATDLTVTVPVSATEGDGVLTNASTVTCSEAPASDLVVDLSSDDTSEVTVQATVTVPAGQTSATFDITIIDNTQIDGFQIATITASATGWTANSDTITIFDDDIVGSFPSIAAGEYHSIALKENGTVWAWGSNYFGQLGDGTNDNRSFPVQVTNLSDIIAVAGGTYHSLALKSDGTVWAWGRNFYGLLGDGTNIDSAVPLQVVNLTDIIAIASGAHHCMALKVDGTLWTWGGNYDGQLGDGTTTDRNTPVQVATLTNVTAIAGGSDHSLALKADGTAWAWGRNDQGQLGDGTTTPRLTPVQVSNLIDLVDISCGRDHSLALKDNGTVWAWGDNFSGQLGDGTTTDKLTPVQVLNLSNVLSIAAGTLYNLVIDVDGTAWSWGTNSHGQLGDGTTTSRTEAVQVHDLESISAISGSIHSIALKTDGTVWAWGYNYSGQLGDGTTTNRSTPVQVNALGGSGFLDLISLTVDLPASATEGDGVLVGQGTVSIDEAPASDLAVNLSSDDILQLTVPGNVVIPAGQTSAVFDITIVDDALLDGSQTVEITASAAEHYPTTGAIQIHDNDSATLTVTIPATATEGDGVLAAQGTVSIDATPDADIIISLTSNDQSEVVVPETIKISAGQTSEVFDLTIIDDTEIDGTQIVTITASVTGWTAGNDTIGVEDNEPMDLTVSVPDNAGERDGLLAAAGAVSVSGTVIADLTIDLSSDDTSEATVPASVTIPSGQSSVSFDLTIIDDPDIDGTQIVTITASAVGWNSGNDTILVYDNDHVSVTPAISTGHYHSLALKNDGRLWVWGNNIYGQLGDAPTIGRSTPAPVSGLTDVVAISGGSYHSLALKSDGTVLAWGRNSYGQLGDGSTTNRTTPVQVTGLINVVVISGGYRHSLALKSDGTVWAWGNNLYGQLGDGLTTSRTTPVQVTGLIDVVAISGGDFHSLALKSDGTVWAWGNNLYGQLGDGSTTNRTTPVQVTGLTDVVAISGGTYHSLALKSDGTVWAWGNNEYGQLGDETNINKTTPVQVPYIADAIAISSGESHSLALRPNGSVLAWGRNYYGQLGDGTTINKSAPIQVSDLANVRAVSASGGSHSLALKADGTVWAWGNNNYGQLGEGTTSNKTIPVQVSDSDGVGFFDLISLSVNLPQGVYEGEGLLTESATVTVDEAPTSDLVLNLSSLDTTELTVQTAVTIPAGQTSANFDLTIVDDTLLDGSQTVRVMASAPGYYSVEEKMQVHDNEIATLTVVVPSNAIEGDGLLLTQGTVTASAAVDTDVTVSLTSDDPIEVTVPAAVTIPMGQTSAVFDLIVNDDTYIEGTKTVTITASVTGWIAGNDTIDVEDNENKNLSITVPSNINETDGILTDSGTISVIGTLVSDLVVDLVSDDTSEILVPSTITIPVGQSSATFDLTVIDDPDIDGTQTVTITASAPGWSSDIGTINVEDNDPGELQFSADTYSVTEGGGDVTITVVRTASSSGTITVDYATGDSTATAGSDYNTASGTLTFNDGETEQTFSISVLEDIETEGSETINLTLSNPGGGASLGSPNTALLTIVDNDNPKPPYSQDFSTGLPTAGWEYYSSDAVGRIQVINSRLRMDVSTSGTYAANEAVLTLDLEGLQNLQLSFFQAEFGDENTTLPASFNGHFDGDGVAISNDGTTWYTILNANNLDIGSAGQTFIVDLDAKVSEIQTNYDATFGYTSSFKIKFQQYDNYSYSSDGREWDNVSVLIPNNPPFAPSSPNPAESAVDAPLTAGSITLSWVGGDPDPGNTVTYDVWFGTSAESLIKVADNISTASFQKDSLTQATTYFWQIVGRDNIGAETSGPVWQFTTVKPDLVVTTTTWVPAADIEAGQQITFTATIQNNGTAPVEDAFLVDFKIDGTSIGTQTVNPVIASGGSVQVNQTWTAQTGDHTIEVVADSGLVVNETAEGNNSLSQNLPTIIDPTPPVLVSTNPADGSWQLQVNQIVFTLSDLYGIVDDAAVIASVSVLDSGNQAVSGTVAESNDQFTFTPATTPMADGTYTVSFTAADVAGNTQNYGFSFTADSPPYSPSNPSPADSAVDVSLTGGSVTLSWTGGDPNAWDSVVYDVFFGTSAGSLVKVADSISAVSFQKDSLGQGITYFWQVVARDNGGFETAGPVWQFTTWRSDLTVTQIVWDPAANLQAGQEITFTATVQNNGTAPVETAFQVDFKIDGASIGTQTVNPVISSGGSAQVVKTWTAQTGDHTIEAVADSTSVINETSEANNSLSANLPTIIDPTPPELVSTNPADGAALQQVDQIIFTLFDQYGVVDDAAVSASVSVLDGGSQSVNGTVSESNDQFTFTPTTAPLADSTYTVSLTAADEAGNTQNYSFSFTVDNQAPVEPTITGATVTSGMIQVRPAQNTSNSAIITLTGTREDNTSIWIDGVKKAVPGTGDWSIDLNLPQGDNALEIWLEDAAGNRSGSIWVDIQVDSIAPAVTSITPADDSFVNTAPATVVIGFDETGSGLNLENSTKSIKDGNQVEVAGTWSVAGGNQLIFTPSGALAESDYTVSVQLQDNLGNQSATYAYNFTVDTTAPPAPEVHPVTTPTNNPTQVVAGTKEAYAAILVNGQQEVDNTFSTDWQHTVNLASGSNSFTFVAKDRAGNQSTGVIVEIVYDDIAPQPVDTLTVDGQSDGTIIYLNWTGYDEGLHGDIDFYRIYVETATFSDVSALTPQATVNAGNFSYTVQNLTKGTTYWFAVIAVDVRGNAHTTATPVTGVPVDVVAPEDVTNLTAQSFADRLVFTWDHSADSYGDLTGYQVYFADEPDAIVLPATQNTYERTGLAGATGYLFRVFAYDTDDNVSIGKAVTGVTWLANPANLAAEPHSGYVDLTWNAATPSEYVKHYAVYVSQADFTSVEGMTPVLTTAAASAKVAGLTNNVTYYFAVTTVNTSDGENPAVTTISATPVPDTEGPEISNVKIDGQILLSGHTVTKPATFSCDAADPAGVSRVEFAIDGSLIGTDYNSVYSGFWNIVPVIDGSYTLTVTAFDTLGNSSSLDFALVVALDPPAAPIITQPANGTITNQPTITVSGQAEKDTEVLLYNNGTDTGLVVPVDVAGAFSTSLTLLEGENRLASAARNRAGTGPLSAEVLVTLDTSLPASPVALTAAAKAAGQIRLSWQPPLETSVSGYNLYRSDSPFTAPEAATKINTNLVTATSFDDLPPAEGTWYYRATTVDTAVNESELSNQVSAVSDSTAPRAVSLEYITQGPFDPASGRMAPGTVDVVLTVSEPLQAVPYLSIAPEGGVPISVELTQDTDVTYSGFFVITDSTPSGTAYAIFSARDVVGNRGTEIDAGASILIDSDGPAVSRLEVVPESPIQNDEQNPVSVTVTIGLNEALKPGTLPALSYLLSKEGREAIVIDQITEIATQTGDAQTWQADFVMAADAGLTEAESFHFIYQGADDLDNIGAKIQAANLFQVYQGDLPPLEVPQGLTAEALPGGKIKLTWNAVEQAADYQLYRKAPGESDLTEYVRPGIVVDYIDEPTEDGTYSYAIASIRVENQQEAVSGMSAAVEVDADSVVPGAPANLTLELVANGIKAEWQAPPYTEEITYSLYRSSAAEITSVEGLTPLATGIEQLLVVDPTPSPTDHAYVVTAVDAVGNESAPSNSVYLNFQLLPVASLNVIQTDTALPVISWTHPGGSIEGYDVYQGADGQLVKLNPARLNTMTYTDIGWAADERRYTVIAVDDTGAESLGRSITLPVIEATVAQGSIIKRGIMNNLNYTVQNLSSAQVDGIKLKVGVQSYDHISETFSLEPGEARTVTVVVGGYEDLADVADLTTTIEITPGTNEKVDIVRTSQIEVADGTLVLQIQNEEFTRAATGDVRFTLKNTGEADIEIVTAKNAGNTASDQITWYLLDEDDNVLTSFAFKQALGDKIVTLSNGNTVARIPEGETFTAEFSSIPVPANSPDNVIVKLSIANVYYHQGQADQVTMDGLSSTHPVTLIDTSYFGEVISITPQSSSGDEDIVISGRAVERISGNPLPDVPLNLVITLQGFERQYEVFTSDDGTFSHTFTPLAGEAGVYTVRAVHPDLTDKPVHAQFVINRLSFTPATVNLNIPRNYEKTIGIRVSTGDGTPVNNLQLAYEEADQPAGTFPVGVHLTVDDPIAFVDANQTTTLNFTVWADNTAAATETMKLKVVSDESAPDAWGMVIVNAQFSEAQPVLYFTPNHVETGVAIDETVIETVVLENRGLEDMYDVQLSLVDSNGSAAPSWVYLNTAADQGTMAIGVPQQASIGFSPTASVPEGVYSFKLRVSGSNYSTTDINLYVSVTQSGIGNALFKVSDIYTGTLDQGGELIQGLAGARVKLQNELVLTEEYTLNTDAYGEAYFTDLPAGRYKVRVTASNHQEYIGRTWVKPGVTVTEDVFLDYNLVTVEWEVTEITIEDKYEIVLNATYETDVPAAVVIIEPASVTLPKMKAGDVFNGEFSLTNYGLIRAEDLNITLPSDDQYFAYEFMGGLPETLEAKQRITIPYRVTCLQSLDQEEEQGSGGGDCYSYTKCAVVDYAYVCTNGVWAWAAINHCWTTTYGECGGGSVPTNPAGGGGGTWSIGGPGGGGTTSKPAPAPKQIEGVECYPKFSLREMFFNKWQELVNFVKDTWNTIKEPVGCTVNTLTREFHDQEMDLVVKVPGGMITVNRWFYNNNWYWEHSRNNLSFKFDSLGSSVETISKGGVEYEVSSVDANIFLSDSYRITKEQDGYRWEDTSGNWKTFDLSGRMTAYGNRIGVIGNLQYEAVEDGKLVGVADRNDNQVLWFEYDADGRISAVNTADNRRVEYTYTSGYLTGIKDALSNDTTYEYDGEGRITRKVDAAGRPTIATYDDYGNVKSVVDQYGIGHFFEFDYDEAKSEQYARITTSSGRIKEVWYDRDGETKRVDINGRTMQTIAKDGRDLIITDEKGKVTRKEFDEWDNLTKIIYPDGTTTSFEYEHKFNKPVRVIDQRGTISEFEYDEQGNLTRKTDAVGTEAERVTTYTYDTAGQLLTATVEADADTQAATTTFTYDGNGNVASITDPEGNATSFLEYDSSGNLIRMQDPREYEWTFEYDDRGRLISQTDPLNNITSYEYDGANNRTAVINAFLKRFEFEYDDHNNLIKAIDPYQKFITTQYNTDNLPTKVIDQEGKSSEVEYDNEGRVIRTIDGAGNEIVYTYDESSETTVSSYKPVRIDYPTYYRQLTYDSMERVIQETDVLDETTSYTRSYVFDASGNVVGTTDEKGNNTQFEYDALNRLIKSTDALGGVVERKYDDRGNLIEIQDPNEGITFYDYDRNNRQIKVIRPMLEETTYGYDATGNRTSVLDSRGQKIAYTYNALNRLTQVNYYAAGDHINPVKTVDFTYDKLGSIKSYDDGTTSATYTYDDLQRKINESVNYGLFTKTYAYTYYDNGLKKTFTGPDSVSIDYTYDENNRISGIAIPGQGQITYNTYQWNSPTRITLPGGSTTDYTYDPLMQVKSIVAKDPGQNPLMTRDYTYSAVGNITAKDTEHGNYVYQYDNLRRLTEAVNPLSNDEAYTYDLLSNRLTDANVPGTWTYNANNELLGYDNVTFAYDDNGNLTRKSVGVQETNYVYDVEDRLVRVENEIGSVIAKYYYDPFGRRLWKEVDSNKTYFLYSDEGLIGEYDQSGAEIRAYGYAPNSGWTTDPLFVKLNGTHYWYQNDHAGTPQKIIDTSGRVVWSAVYDSFGNIQIQTAEIINNLRFAGQYFDSETGLYYNLNRYYDPVAGRYLRSDPFGEGLNLYAYVFNNPVNLIDPLGLCALKGIGNWIVEGIGDWYTANFSSVGDGNPLHYYIPSMNYLSTDTDGLIYAAIQNGLLAPIWNLTTGIANEFLRLQQNGPQSEWDILAVVLMNPELSAAAQGLSQTIRNTFSRLASKSTRFIARQSGGILDVTKINIPGPRNSPFGKLDYLLGKVPGSQKSFGKGKFFKDSLGFNNKSLDKALRSHLTDNFGNAVIDGNRIRVTGQIVGPTGKTANIKSVWQITESGSIDFITAQPF